MKFYITVILMMMGATLSGFAQKERQLVMLHTNDMHSTIWPLSEELPDGGSIPTCCCSTAATLCRGPSIIRCSRAMLRWG